MNDTYIELQTFMQNILVKYLFSMHLKIIIFLCPSYKKKHPIINNYYNIRRYSIIVQMIIDSLSFDCHYLKISKK